VDLRVISSTTRDLRAEIAAGRFRQELYHRLNVVPISRALAGGTARGHSRCLPAISSNSSTSAQGLPRREIGEEAEAQLQAMPWPGNVRQLRNVIERA
jgi:two-component system, NtrC family, nitrogen regulation response regulator NtrX